MSTRAEILDTLAASQTQVMTFLQRLSPEDLVRPATASEVPGEAPWRARDHLAHVVESERRMSGSLSGSSGPTACSGTSRRPTRQEGCG
jgi:hypothetical protein